MKTKIKMMALVAGLLSVLPMTSAWAHSGTHYGKISVSASGEGTVYLSDSNNATSGSTSTEWDCGGASNSSDSKTYYLYAVPKDENYGFVNWTKDDGAQVSTLQNCSVTATSTGTSKENPSANNYVAHFAPYRRYRAKLTCEATEGGEVAIGEAANFATKVSAPEQVSEKSLKDNEVFSFAVHAQANENWSFVRWADASGKELATTVDYTHKVTSSKYGDQIEDVTITAVFAQSHTYYAQANVAVDASCAAGGLVALSRTNSESGLTFGVEDSLADNGTLADSSVTFTYYAFAKCADDWWDFGGWYEAGKRISRDANTSFAVTTSSEDAENPDGRTLIAKFVSAPLVTATCEKSEFGSYTVSGTCNMSPTAEKVIAAGTGTDSVALPRSLSITLSAPTPADGYKFRRWWKQQGDGSKMTLSESVSVSFDVPSEGATVGVDFIEANKNFVVGESYYESYSDAFTAGQTDATIVSLVGSYEVGDNLTIPSDVVLLVPQNATLTVNAGVMLTVNGTLKVAGSIVKNGDIGGTGIIAYNAKTITQEAKVNVPYPAGTDGPAGSASGTVAADENNKANEVSTAGKYLNTSVANGVSELANVSLTKKYYVTVVNKASGETFMSSLLDSAPKAVVCTVSRDKALNWISGMNGETSAYSDVKSALDKAQSTDGSGVANYKDGTNLMAVLTGDGGTVTYDGGGSTVIAFGTIVDLAGKSLTVSASNKTQFNRHCIVRAFNGSFTVSQKVMSTKFYLYNCTGSLGYLCGGNQYGTAAYLYDSPQFSITFKDLVSDTPAGSLNFCGGGTYGTSYVKFQTTPKTKFNVVYAGTFASGMDPRSYLWDDNKVEAVQDPSTRNWIVQDKYVDPNKGQTLVNGEEHSLVEALESAAAGDVIKLLRDVELEEDLILAADKSVRLDLSGFALSGNFKIINNGELEIIDCNNGVAPSPVGAQIVNNGTLLLSKAAYNGQITLNAGLCYFLAGSFNGDIVFAAGTVPGEIAQVRGGTYAKANYKIGDAEGSLLTLCENGYAESGMIARIPDSYIQGPGMDKIVSFSIRALTPYLEGLVTRVSSYEANRDRYSKDEWIDLMTARASSTLFSSWNVDCAARVDRPVGNGDLKLTVLFVTEDVPAIAVGDSATILLPAMRDSGFATSPWGYQSILPGGENASKVSFDVQGGAVAEGTSVWMEMRLVRSLHVNTVPKDWSYSGPYVVTGTRRFVVGAETNRAMVWGASGGATFYSTLNNAVAGVAEGAAIKLCNDCGEDVTVGKVCTIDTNGFEFKGDIAAATGYALVDDGNGTYTVTRDLPAVAKIGDVEYTDIYEAMAAAAEQKATLVLLADITADVQLTPDWSLNLNGYQVDGALEVAEDYKADYWLKRSGDIYSVAPYVAQVGGAKYSSLQNAINAVKWKLGKDPTVITLLADCAENVALPAGIVINKNGKNLSGTVTPPQGYDVTGEAQISVELNYVAVVGSTTYATLDAAIEAVAAGGTVRITKNCAATKAVAKECAVNSAGFAVTGLAPADDYTMTEANGISVFAQKYVAQVLEEKFETLANAIEAIVSLDGSADDAVEIQLLKDCDEDVIVRGACKFSFDIPAKFIGTIAASDGFAVSVNGGVWSVSAAKSVTLESEKIAAKVSGDVYDTVKAELEKEGPEATEEEVKEVIAAAIEEAVQNKQFAADADGMAKVSKDASNVKQIEAEIDKNADMSKQGTGIYQATKVVEIAVGETLETKQVVVVDSTATPNAVIQNVSKEESIILAVPGNKVKVGDAVVDVTVANVVSSTPTIGDAISVWEKKSGQDEMVRHSWLYKGDGWTLDADEASKVDETERTRLAAANYKLEAGSAFRYIRMPGNTAPVTVVTQYEEDTTVVGKVQDAGWNIVANPNVDAPFNLNAITPETGVEAKDVIVVPTDDGGRREFTRQGDGWGYEITEKVQIGKKTALQRRRISGDANVNVAPGKGFWYFSESATDEKRIPWRGGASK